MSGICVCVCLALVLSELLLKKCADKLRFFFVLVCVVEFGAPAPAPEIGATDQGVREIAQRDGLLSVLIPIASARTRARARARARTGANALIPQAQPVSPVRLQHPCPCSVLGNLEPKLRGHVFGVLASAAIACVQHVLQQRGSHLRATLSTEEGGDDCGPLVRHVLDVPDIRQQRRHRPEAFAHNVEREFVTQGVILRGIHHTAVVSPCELEDA
eukprot:scaffold53619_cov63-Phaeocystis_antarctica.AAC.3